MKPKIKFILGVVLMILGVAGIISGVAIIWDICNAQTLECDMITVQDGNCYKDWKVIGNCVDNDCVIAGNHMNEKLSEAQIKNEAELKKAAGTAWGEK